MYQPKPLSVKNNNCRGPCPQDMKNGLQVYNSKNVKNHKPKKRLSKLKVWLNLV